MLTGALSKVFQIHTHAYTHTQDTPAVRSLSQTPFTRPLEDMSPFFQKQYIRANSTDIFAAYGRLLAEILLVLPCQVWFVCLVTITYYWICTYYFTLLLLDLMILTVCSAVFVDYSFFVFVFVCLCISVVCS